MNNQEAISILGQYDVSNIHFYTTDGEEIPLTEWSDAIEMAIHALQEQETKSSSTLSAKPLIRCQDCKYRGGLSGYYCDIVEKMVGVDSFCSWSERRTDG